MNFGFEGAVHLQRAMEGALADEALNRKPPRPWVPHITATQVRSYRKTANDALYRVEGPQMRTTTISGQKPVSTTPLAELTPTTLRGMTAPRVHNGQYLICRTLIPSTVTVSVMTLLQDTRGDIELAAFHYFQESLKSDPNEWLPEGTILLIKEPYMKLASQGTHDPMIRVDSPSDVIFLHESDNLLRSTEWYRPLQQSFEDLKAEGNRLFGANRFEKAIQMYDLALQKEPGHPVINLNKAAALLPIGRYSEAYECALFAKGREGADQVKVLFRLGRSAYGLRDWEKAVEHFSELIEMKPDSTEGRELLDRAKHRLDESQTGQYDMPFLLRNSKAIGIDAADFVGPIEVVDIPGKRRGIVTTAAVPQGTLLFVSKAFALGVPPPDLKLWPFDAMRNVAWPLSQYCALVKTVQKLRKNPQLSNEFYSLWSDESDRGVMVPPGIIDAGRIERICRMNVFNIEAVGRKEQPDDRTGVWILPSFINHSCVRNVEREHYGDLMMVHAIRDLAQGEELCFSYCHDLSLEGRTEFLQTYGFRCECPLCIEERNDPTRPARMRIYTNYMNNLRVSSPQEQIAAITRLQNSYPPGARFRVHLCEPYSNLGHRYWRLGNLVQAAAAFEEALKWECGVLAMREKTKMLTDLARVLHEIGREDDAVDRVRELLDCFLVKTGFPRKDAAMVFPDLAPNDYIRFVIDTIIAE